MLRSDENATLVTPFSCALLNRRAHFPLLTCQTLITPLASPLTKSSLSGDHATQSTSHECIISSLFSWYVRSIRSCAVTLEKNVFFLEQTEPTCAVAHLPAPNLQEPISGSSDNPPSIWREGRTSRSATCRKRNGRKSKGRLLLVLANWHWWLKKNLSHACCRLKEKILLHLAAEQIERRALWEKTSNALKLERLSNQCQQSGRRNHSNFLQ